MERGELLRWVPFGLTFGFLSLGRTGAYKPSAYRHTSVCLMLVVEPTSPVRALINPYLKQKSRDKTPLFYFNWWWIRPHWI